MSNYVTTSNQLSMLKELYAEIESKERKEMQEKIKKFDDKLDKLLKED